MRKFQIYILIIFVVFSCMTNDKNESKINSCLDIEAENYKKNIKKYNLIKDVICSVNWKNRKPKELEIISNQWSRNADIYNLFSKKMEEINISKINLDFNLEDTTIECISFYLNKSEINGIFRYEIYLKKVSFHGYSNTENYSYKKINERTILVYEN